MPAHESPHVETVAAELSPMPLLKPEPINSLRRELPVAAAITNAPGARSVTAYNAVIDQFDVTMNRRYLPAGGNTFCNIFAGDVMAAMNAVLPHWVMPDGTPATPRTTGAREQNVNALYDWLRLCGRRYGWSEIRMEDAQSFANEGKPTLGVYQAPPRRHGHIVVIRPGDDDGEGPWCAQAGTMNLTMARAKKCLPGPRKFWSCA